MQQKYENERNNKKDHKGSSCTISTTAFSFSAQQNERDLSADVLQKDFNLSVENEDARICSTTSGISSNGSSNTLISCCNNNEECRFNNSTKRYCTNVYQKDLSETYGHISNDNRSKGCMDTLTSKSSYGSRGSNCSFCCCSMDYFEEYENGSETNLLTDKKHDINTDIIKNSQFDANRISTQRLFLEKM